MHSGRDVHREIALHKLAQQDLASDWPVVLATKEARLCLRECIALGSLRHDIDEHVRVHSCIMNRPLITIMSSHIAALGSFWLTMWVDDMARLECPNVECAPAPAGEEEHLSLSRLQTVRCCRWAAGTTARLHFGDGSNSSQRSSHPPPSQCFQGVLHGDCSRRCPGGPGRFTYG